MTSLAMARNCGGIGYMLLVLGTLGVLVSFGTLVALVSVPTKRSAFRGGAASLILGVFVVLVASMGTWIGRMATDGVLADSAPATPEEAQRVRAQGYAEAAQCMPVGVLSAALPILVGIAALVTATTRKDDAGA